MRAAQPANIIQFPHRVPMPEIASVLGHSDSRLTERVYAVHSPGYLRNAVRSLE